MNYNLWKINNKGFTSAPQTSPFSLARNNRFTEITLYAVLSSNCFQILFALCVVCVPWCHG